MMKNVVCLFKKDFLIFTSSFKKKNAKYGVSNALSGFVLTAIIFAAFVYVFKNFADNYVGLVFGETGAEILRVNELLIIAFEAVFLIDIIVGIKSIYGAVSSNKDMDVLIYQPIDSREIFAYKFIKIYFSQLVSSFLAVLPVVIVMDIVSPAAGGTAYYALSVLNIVLLPLASCTMSALLSIPVIAVMRAIEDKFVIKLILYVIVLGVGFWLYSRFLAILTELLKTGEMKNSFDLNAISAIHNATEKMYPGKFFAEMLLGKNLGRDMGILLAICLAGLAASLFLVRLIYNKVVQKNLEGKPKYFRKPRKYRPKGVVESLLYKEFVTVLRTPTYAFQYFATTVTLPFMVYVCVNLLRSLMSTLTIFNCDFELAMFVISMFGILTNTFSMSNISRDGQMYKTLKTMPISCKQYMTAKLVFCGIVSVFSVLASCVILLSVGFLNAWQAVYAFVVGGILSMAEVMFVTRKDMNAPSFAKKNETVELNGSTSTLILVGLLVSLVAGGGAVALNAVLSFITSSALATLASVGLITLFAAIYAVVAVIYFLKGLKNKYYMGDEARE
ncbi:MAG: hypothetical protein MR239_06630 [Clostridiales bacterium]|nr:hypothetical protein [Clostridiales bacterium]MDY4655500.1 hypothetical protein [Eubacteriales bacterium]